MVYLFRIESSLGLDSSQLLLVLVTILQVFNPTHTQEASNSGMKTIQLHVATYMRKQRKYYEV